MQNPFDPGYYKSEELRTFGFKSVGHNVQIATNCIIIVPENIELDDQVRIDGFTTLIAGQGSIRLGAYVHIHTCCLLGGRGGLDIGDFSGLSHGVKVLTASDDFNGEFMINSNVPAYCVNPIVKPVKIGRHVPVGVNSSILPGVIIGDGAAVCAMTLVRKSLEPWGIYHGNPAKRLCSRSKHVLELEARMNGRRSLNARIVGGAAR
jgi:acetyltransferase-like isoleucine patch superfamily enzyme